MNITCISDTHNNHEKLILKSGEVLIHSGDYTGYKNSLEDFLIWMSKQKFEFKILIAGNHDKEIYKMGYNYVYELAKKYNIIYLENTSVNIKGILFYGAPWSVTFGGWDFMKKDEALYYEWNKIPENIDVLITHGPAYNVGDKVLVAYNGSNVGSISLMNKIKTLKNLKAHIFGHIHWSYGVYENEYIAVNASNVYEYFEKKPNELKKPITITI